MSTDLHTPEAAPELDLYPIWKQAAKDAAATFAYGDMIPIEWVRDHLEILELDEDDQITLKQHRDLAFDLLRKTEMFKLTMLETHQRLLVNIRGCGYKVIEPPHQTEAAMRKFITGFHKSWHQAMSALVHINADALSLEDTQRNIEAKMKLNYLKTMTGETLKPPAQVDDTPRIERAESAAEGTD